MYYIYILDIATYSIAVACAISLTRSQNKTTKEISSLKEMVSNLQKSFLTHDKEYNKE